MMSRIEHFNDPNAPMANSIVVAASAFVQDLDGHVLLIRRSDNDLWALPGGAQDIGEHISQTAEREVREETGYEVEVTGIIGVYSNPQHVMAYSNGEVRQQFALVFRARLLGGEAQASAESPEIRWVAVDDLAALPIHPSIRLRIQHGLEKGSTPPHIG